MEEEWLPVVGFEDRYVVSNYGRLRSIDRVDSAGRFYRGRTLVPWPDGKGYLKFNLSRDGRRTSKFVHALVLEAFAGPRPDGYVTRHLDGNPLNNVVDNLAWGTPHENNMDIVRHGNHFEANKTHCPAGHRLEAPNLVNRRCRQCKACKQASAFVWRRPEFRPHFQEVADLCLQRISGEESADRSLLDRVNEVLPSVWSGLPARYTYGPGRPRPKAVS